MRVRCSGAAAAITTTAARASTVGGRCRSTRKRTLWWGRYTPLFNYERSVSNPDGHRNAVFARRGVRPLPRIPMTNPPNTQLFYVYLKNFGGLDAHSTGTDQGTNWNANDPTVETTV